MSTRKKLIVVVAAATIVVAWRLLESNTPVPIMDLPVESAAVEQAATIESPPTLERETVTPLETPPAPAAVPEVPDATSPVVFDAASAKKLYTEKYRDATTDQLVLAQYHLDQQLTSERTRIIKEIQDSGKYDTVIVKPGDQAPSLPQTTSESPVSSGFIESGTSLDDPTQYVVKLKTIDAATYPEFHALELEWWWVSSEVYHREKLAREAK